MCNRNKRAKSTRRVTAEEKALWLAFNEQGTATETIVSSPLVLSEEKSPLKKAVKPKPQQAVMPRQALRRLSKSHIATMNTLDLHGLTLEAAQMTLTHFLQSRAQAKQRRVLVITGKGKSGVGLIRQQLPLWLELSPLNSIVSSYRQANKAHGGSGAFYIFLR